MNKINFSKISPQIGYYLTGFTDGAGSFQISFRPWDYYKMLWKISLCFNVSQKDKVILTLFKKHFRCGSLRNRDDGIWYYEVNNFTAIVQNVIPFFQRYGFLSVQKKNDFAKFRQIAELIEKKNHLTKEGIRKILYLRDKMNNSGKHKYSSDFIWKKLEKSPETIRQTEVNISDEIVRTS
jgi:hypothetical protein